MSANGSAARAILASGFVGAAFGAPAGAVFGGLAMPLTALLCRPSSDGQLVGFVLLLLVALGAGYGLVLGALGGFMAGALGACLGGPWGWAAGGLIGGYHAGLAPSTWFPWPIEVLAALLGAAVTGAMGIALCAGEIGTGPLDRLSRILENSDLRRWLPWQRALAALCLLLLFAVITSVLHGVFESPLALGASWMPHR